MDKKQSNSEARRLFLEADFNCSEAVWLGLAKDLSKNEKDFGCRLAGGFGGGLGCGKLCGALGGAVMGIGIFLGREPGNPRNQYLKQVTEQLCVAFEKQFGSKNCCDIKPTDGDYRSRCADFVEFCEVTVNDLIDAALESDADC